MCHTNLLLFDEKSFKVFCFVSFSSFAVDCIQEAHLLYSIVCVTARTNILIHKVPVEILQLFRCEINAGYFIGTVLWCLEAIPIINVDRWIWMAWSISCHRNFRFHQWNLVENASNGQKKFLEFEIWNLYDWRTLCHWSIYCCIRAIIGVIVKRMMTEPRMRSRRMNIIRCYRWIMVFNFVRCHNQLESLQLNK